jgi:hypothetical protein
MKNKNKNMVKLEDKQSGLRLRLKENTLQSYGK